MCEKGAKTGTRAFLHVAAVSQGFVDQQGKGPAWHMVWMYGSLAQGGHDAQPGFCIVFAVVVQRIKEKLAAVRIVAYIWLYTNDVAIHCGLSLVRAVWQIVLE